MSAHLLAIAIGPVQEFIAAARRTRDLWFGSMLLSEISKATARAVYSADSKALIFPAPAGPADLEPLSPLNVANVIVAELKDGDPKQIAAAAKGAAEKRWHDFADRVHRENAGVIRGKTPGTPRGIWFEQVDDIIEFYAAWVPLADSTPYEQARKRLMRLLAGRKNCRNFGPALGHAGIPKSSLDGLRESVLKDPAVEPWPEKHRRRLRVREGEQLDVIGLVKRTWSPPDGEDNYPSVSRVAADPWLRGLVETSGENVLESMREACQQLGPQVLHVLDISRHPHYDAFPFEGTAVFRTRHHELKEEAELSDLDLKRLSDSLRALVRRAGEPNPYLAVIAADGDKMGRAIGNLKSAKEHREFSRALSEFASEARAIVHAHKGVLVYSGGDDVLAFVPLDQCLKCARALHDKFEDLMRTWSAKTGVNLTLSVGVAIAHFLENLEDLLEFARAAEKHSKKPRADRDADQHEKDGLAVHLHKRGGAPVVVRANWKIDDPLDSQLADLAAQLDAQAISGRTAYDLFRVAEVYEGWCESTVAEAIRGDALRAIAAKQPRGKSAMSKVSDTIREHVSDAASLRRLADKLLIARQITIAIRQAQGQPVLEEVTV